MAEPSSVDDVLRAALLEARTGGAAVMALVPPGVDSAEIGERLCRDADDVEVWVLPQPPDLVAMLLQSPETDQLVVASIEDSALIDTFTGRADALPRNISLIIVPGHAEVSARQRSNTCLAAIR